MTSVHLQLDGRWQTCLDTSACELPYHLTNMTLAEARLLPVSMVEQLLQAADPPVVSNLGSLQWLDDDFRLHRDYDLPAKIDPDGNRWWFQHGLAHRSGGKPAIVYADGGIQWWERGQLHRELPNPALISKEPGKPTRLQYWQKGIQYEMWGLDHSGARFEPAIR